MVSQPYTIQVITSPTDLNAWTAAQYASFMNTGNVHHDTLFPPATNPTPADITASAKRHLDDLQTHPDNIIFIQILDPTNNAIMGGAQWQFWSHDPKRPSTIEVDWIDDSTAAGCEERRYGQAVMDEFQGRRARDMAMPHGLLDICFTTPGYERRGVGSALVRWGLERVDKEGWVSFTEASERGMPVYERLGFERKEEVRLRFDDLGVVAQRKGDVIWELMMRPVGGKKT